jgi:hypothetical protein
MYECDGETFWGLRNQTIKNIQLFVKIVTKNDPSSLQTWPAAACPALEPARPDNRVNCTEGAEFVASKTAYYINITEHIWAWRCEEASTCTTGLRWVSATFKLLIDTKTIYCLSPPP